MKKEMFVVEIGYDYEGSDVVGVFESEAEALACMQEEIAEDCGDYVFVSAYCGRESRQIVFQRLDEEEEEED